MNNFYIYILECADGSYYVGHTDDIEKRILEHKSGIASAYTKDKLPVKVLYSENFASRTEAFNAERKLKSWSRFKKELLIKHGLARFKGF